MDAGMAWQGTLWSAAAQSSLVRFLQLKAAVALLPFLRPDSKVKPSNSLALGKIEFFTVFLEGSSENINIVAHNKTTAEDGLLSLLNTSSALNSRLLGSNPMPNPAS